MRFIDADKLIEEGWVLTRHGVSNKLLSVKSIADVPTAEVAQSWIPCNVRMPEEHESIFKKAKGTDKWDNAMFEGISDDVNVTVEFEDGTRTTKTAHTTDGKWSCEKGYGIKMKVIAWQPLPKPYNEV